MAGCAPTNSPAAEVGNLYVGDVVVEINGNSVIDSSFGQVVAMIAAYATFVPQYFGFYGHVFAFLNKEVSVPSVFCRTISIKMFNNIQMLCISSVQFSCSF